MSRPSLWFGREPFGRGAAALCLALCAWGCKGADDEADGPSFVPKAVAFEGKPNPQYAGSWRNSNGTSVIDLGKDGSLKIESTTNAQSGKSTTTIAGKWGLSGNTLFFNYPEKAGTETTLRYDAKLNGGTLVLGQSGGKLKTTYTRK